MINHIKVIGIFILSLLLCSIETHAVGGSQITGDKIDIDVAGNLTIETPPDTWQGSGSSWNANIGTGGFGGGQGAITEDKNWTETPAGIFGKSEVDIDVGDTTKLIGGAIVSETDGGLELVTGKLEVEDVAINDYARDEYTGGQVNVNIGGIINGDIDHSNDTKKDDLFNENKYGTVEHSDAGHDKQGVIKGTISGGTVTVGGERDEDGNAQGGETLDVAALEDMGINTDSDNIVTITKDESWDESFKIDLVNVGVAAEQVDNLVNVVESFAAKVPDHIKADGKEGEDIWRKAIANGMSQDEATSFAGTQEYADLVEIRRHIEQDKDENGRYNPETVYVALNLELSRIQGYYENNCASGASSIPACNKLVSLFENGGVSADDLSIEGLNGLIATYKYILANSETQAGQAKYRQILHFAELCKEEYTAKIVQDSFESGNDQQMQELLANDATRPDIIDGMINYAGGFDARVAGLDGDADSYFNYLSPLLDVMENPEYAQDLDIALSNQDYMFGDLHQEAFKDLLSASSMYRDGELTETERSELEGLANYYNNQYNDLVNDKSAGFDNFGEGSLRDFYRNVSASLNKAAKASDASEASQYLQEGFEDINTDNIQARLAATASAGVLAGIGRGAGGIKITYHPRVRQRGVEDPRYHNFPYSMDKKILSSKPIKQKDGALLYQRSGSVNGKQGNYEIALNPETGVIFHRQFKPNK